MIFPKELVLAMEIAIQAGSIIMEVYLSNDKDVAYKDDDSPLTKADLLSHQHISKGLEASSLPVISEEGNPDLWSKRLTWPRYWLIDPLDGTKEFVKRNGEFTVNIALMENHIPIWGIIYAPVSRTLFVGMVGIGAWVWENPKIEKINLCNFIKEGATLPKNHKNNTLTIVGSKSYLTETTISFIEKLGKTMGNPEFIRAGSSLKFCRIATGEADVYPRMDSIMEWDIAAGQAIIEAAGGLMVKWPDNTSITYTSNDMRSPWFVAVAPGRDGKELLKAFAKK